jgi:lysophospholipase L1-like esterase
MNRRLLILPIALLLVGVAVAGVILWRRPPAMESDNIFRNDTIFGHTLVPNLRQAKVVMPGRPHPTIKMDSRTERDKVTKRVTYYCSTNSMGFRGPEIALNPAPGTVRIVCLGDSITFGHGVADDQCYPAVLQKVLASHGSFEVINFGVHRYHSGKMLLQMQQRVLWLHPRVVTICAAVNETLKQIEHIEPKLFQLEIPEECYRQALYEFRNNMLQIVDLARRNSITLILLVPPATSFFPFQDIHGYCDIVREIASEQHLPLIDLERIFAARERQDGLVLETEGDTQRVLAFHNGVPQEVFSAPVVPGGVSNVTEAVYEFLDKNPVSQRLSITGTHPNAEGDRLIAELLAPEILRQVAVPAEEVAR